MSEKWIMQSAYGCQKEGHCAGISSKGELKAMYDNVWQGSGILHSLPSPSRIHPLSQSSRERKGHYWHLGAGWFFVVWDYPVPCRIFTSLTPPLNASSTFQSLTQKSPQSLPRVDITVLSWALQVRAIETGRIRWCLNIAVKIYHWAGMEWVIKNPFFCPHVGASGKKKRSN